MKILMINCLDHRYGSVRRSRPLFSALKSLGHRVTYLESNYREKDPGIINIPQSDNIWGYFKGTVRRLYFCLFSEYDILFIFKLNPLTSPCLLAGKLRNKKIIVDWDDLDSEFQGNPVRKTLTKLVEEIAPRQVPLVTTHNEFLRDYALKKKAKNVFVLPPSVESETFDPSRFNPPEIKKSIGLNGKRVLTFLGTLTSGGARDLEPILSSFKKVSATHDNLHLQIVGGGPLREKIEKMLKEYAITDYGITGTIPHSEVPRFLAVSDIFLIYMRDDPGNRLRLSFKLMEYLCMEKPVVARLVGASSEMFSRFCLNAQNPDDFTNRISSLLDGTVTNPSGGRNFISAHFSRDYCLGALKEIIR